MRGFERTAQTLEDLGKVILSLVLILVAGGVWGAFFDMLNGGPDDPVGDGLLTGVVIVALVFVPLAGLAAVACVEDSVKASRWYRRRVAARNTRDAARRRQEERRIRQARKRELWERTH